MTSDADVSAAHACPVCADPGNLRPLCEIESYTVHACATCGAEHAWPMPPTAELEAFYDRPEWFMGGEMGGYSDYDSQTRGSTHLLQTVLDRFAGRSECTVLDIGCGYGNHLAAVASRGWRCFGIEPSDHARGVAKQRLGEAAHIVEGAADLFPHKFDLVLLFDVIEHLPSPYAVLYELFTLDAIKPDTLVVITTPNAGSSSARQDPATWEYRHPPSHLVYYTRETLEYFLRRMRFTDIEIQGVTPNAPADADLSACAGLMAVASGSDFQNFMHERYVPGTWSKIAAYEHVPRYDLARTLAAGKRVLDFGCGTGYGAAVMASVAERVTGLDIDESALAWARQTHRLANLDYQRQDDLGESLPVAAFDLVTCLEMIEHVDHETQRRAVASMGRLLRDDGLLLISTPNPEVTKLYGENPYHIREMTEIQFRELLSPHFAHIQVLRQRVRSGVTFSRQDRADTFRAAPMHQDSAHDLDPPMAFLALCSRQPLADLLDYVFVDDSGNYVAEFVDGVAKLHAARAEAYTQGAAGAGRGDELPKHAGGTEPGRRGHERGRREHERGRREHERGRREHERGDEGAA